MSHLFVWETLPLSKTFGVRGLLSAVLWEKPWDKEPAACSKFDTKDCIQSWGSANWNLNLHQKTLAYEVEQLSETRNLTTLFNYKIVMLKNVLTFMFHTIKVQILSQLDKNPV